MDTFDALIPAALGAATAITLALLAATPPVVGFLIACATAAAWCRWLERHLDPAP